MVDLNKIINITRYIFPVVIIALVIAGMVMPLGNKFIQEGGKFLSYNSISGNTTYTDEITDELYINKYCRKLTNFVQSGRQSTPSLSTTTCTKLKELDNTEYFQSLKALYGLTILMVIITGILFILLLLGKTVVSEFLQIFISILAIINLSLLVSVINDINHDYSTGGILLIVAFIIAFIMPILNKNTLLMKLIAMIK